MPFPPHPHLKPEEQARLYLWQSALREAGSLLKLADRARASIETQEVKTKDSQYMSAMHTYIRARPDYEPGNQKLSHFFDFEAISPRPLGDSLDFSGYYNACRMLAVIFFSQVFKSGYEEQNAVVGNAPGFVKLHLNELLSRSGLSPAELLEFVALRRSTEVARDEMLAHADGKAFEFRENSAGIQFKLPSAALEKINFDSLAVAIGRLQDSLRQYLHPTAA